ncbi:WxcM-like, C-terminal [Natronincola peptidivorans]|uniref:WxcM-like, C-terminal n=1 Tax=Natronincola peptidivorans TaxID=426128 RepID=A0A1H9ZSJ4_9FIRM|nr:FdtA/QdtA family cupin domain-containing protein [Natronincola peptidivorans]SES84693.1 WxcM-like, C-terminal [Natronincola peptidivorans]
MGQNKGIEKTKNWKVLSFNRIGDNEIGYLTPVEENKEIPFLIKRVYYIYNVPEEIERGFHAHRKLEQVLICMNGSVDIKVDNGYEQEIIRLNDPAKGLYIGPHTWREMLSFDASTVLVVLASQTYDESDYIRNYSDFIDVRDKLL